MKNSYKLFFCFCLIALLFFHIPITSQAGFNLDDYSITDDGDWIVEPYGSKTNVEEGRVVLHLLVDSSDRSITSVNNYYYGGYIDEQGIYQTAVIYYCPQNLSKEDELNGYEIWTGSYGYPIGEWYFAGFGDSYGSLPNIFTLTTDFQFPEWEKQKTDFLPFTVTKENTTHIYALQGNENFLNENTDSFIKWAKNRQDSITNIYEQNTIVSVHPEELQNVEIRTDTNHQTITASTPVPNPTSEITIDSNLLSTIIKAIFFLLLITAIFIFVKLMQK